MGVSFLCPCCALQRVQVWFENPIDGLACVRGATAHRRGLVLDELTLSGRVVIADHCVVVVQGGCVVEVE